MSFIFNSNKTIDVNNPAFLPGMCCANFQGTRYSFERVDVSRLTDLSLFFADSPNLQGTPEIDVTGKTGLDTMFKGCTDLLLPRFVPKCNQDFTLYTVPRGSEIPASTLAIILANGGVIELDDPDTAKTLTLSNSMYAELSTMMLYKNSAGSWFPYDTGTGIQDTFVNIMAQAGWSITRIQTL